MTPHDISRAVLLRKAHKISMDTISTTPLTETTFFILLSLSPAPKHGYAIMKEVLALSNRRIVFSTGTLYGAIRRLLEQGWIERVNDPQPNKTSRQRKAYTLTEQGRRVLNAEVERLKNMVDLVKRRVVENPS